LQRDKATSDKVQENTKAESLSVMLSADFLVLNKNRIKGAKIFYGTVEQLKIKHEILIGNVEYLMLFILGF